MNTYSRYSGGWRASTPLKETRKKNKKRKGIKAQRVKPSTPSGVSDALIGDEEQYGKYKRTKRKIQGEGPPTKLPRTFQPPPTTRRDHTVIIL